MMDVMTDKQFDKIMQMIRMVLDGCKDLEEAKKKVDQLMENRKDKEEVTAQRGGTCHRSSFLRRLHGRTAKNTHKQHR